MAPVVPRKTFTAISIGLAGVLFVAMSLFSSAGRADFRDDPFEEYLKKQTVVSVRGLINNISPRDGARGSVIASPERVNPDYYFHWVRDAALVMDVIETMFRRASGEERARLGRILDDYVEFSRRNQTTQTLTGLGEPKFYVDGTAFDLPWGRPQNDGPALRALTLTRWAETLIRSGQRRYVEAKLYNRAMPPKSVIKADLEYVANHWQERGFDLWEEISGTHFYTRMVQREALTAGAELAHVMGDNEAAKYYMQQARAINHALEKHWDGRAGRIRQTIDRNGGVDYKDSGLDSATVLAVLHCRAKEGPFSLMDERVLATADQLQNAFIDIYPINRRNLPVAVIGRYPEDRYYGGNPWVLTTAAFAQLHYELAQALEGKEMVQLKKGHAKFFNGAFPKGIAGEKLKAGMKLKRGSDVHRELVKALNERGDDFLRRVQMHGHPNGGLDEQIHRESGFMTSARDLTWSYASFLTAVWARQGLK